MFRCKDVRSAERMLRYFLFEFSLETTELESEYACAHVLYDKVCKSCLFATELGNILEMLGKTSHFSSYSGNKLSWATYEGMPSQATSLPQVIYKFLFILVSF